MNIFNILFLWLVTLVAYVSSQTCLREDEAVWPAQCGITMPVSDSAAPCGGWVVAATGIGGALVHPANKGVVVVNNL
ncbi:hypothetical protein EVAR_71230_1 [Eumeta japonica]|uniref:Uncharacterized protein n=1 Tax=Eumeta variegata TaxID=151549 RepID=A0A4C2AFT2_EUMVA|nr:hypothetical protein EVAR_71230_1 [Eumeta japonica]